MNPLHLEYLLQFVQDELRDLLDGSAEIRIHPIMPIGIKKSVDLPQDYDPNENNLHQMRGVRVRVSSREYIFPVSWVADNEFDKIKAQTQEIREFYFTHFS